MQYARIPWSAVELYSTVVIDHRFFDVHDLHYLGIPWRVLLCESSNPNHPATLDVRPDDHVTVVVPEREDAIHNLKQHFNVKPPIDETGTEP